MSECPEHPEPSITECVPNTEPVTEVAADPPAQVIEPEPEVKAEPKKCDDNPCGNS